MGNVTKTTHQAALHESFLYYVLGFSTHPLLYWSLMIPVRWVLSNVSIYFPLDKIGSSYSNVLTVSTLGSETEYKNGH